MIWMAIGAGVCAGAPITRVSDARGCVQADGTFKCGKAGTGNGNFLTGFVGNESGVDPQNGELRSFFRFDLSGISGPVVTAAFQVTLPVNGYLSVDAGETFGLFDYLLDPAVLGASPLPAGAFADLGTGTLYGSGAFTLASEGTLTTISLNAAAVAAINSALGGQFAMGGAGTALAQQTDQRELLFGDSMDTATAQLVLGFGVLEDTNVPEPGAGLLVAAGLAGLAYWRRR